MTQMKGWKHILLILRFFMVLVYLGVGVLILCYDVLPLPVNNTGTIFLGSVFILYGIFRLYSFFSLALAKHDEEEV